MTTPRLPERDLDEYRITSDVEILDLLKRMLAERTLITLSGPHGGNYTTMLWSLEEERRTMCFSASDGDANLDVLLEAGEVTGVGYLDSIKVQFDVDGLIEVHAGNSHALNARIPRVAYRFQRRSSFRVQPFADKGPVARFRHPAMPEMQVSLRVIDVSLGGVALFLPDNVPAIEPGTTISKCQLSLDDETQLDVKLVIHHVTAIHPETRGVRLGCEITGQDWGDRSLQHYINQTQKRRLALPPSGKR